MLISDLGVAMALDPLPVDRGMTEGQLQDLIHRHPEILPIREIEGGFGNPVSICRELPTPHGPIDNLLMTPEGNLILVEAKLWRNPEARRKVVAQALDYASCLFEMDYEQLEKAIFRANMGDKPRPSRLYDMLATEGEVADESRFIDAVNTNLRLGRVLIIVVGDGIRTETERLADLVQSQARAHFTFALVELTLYSVAGSNAILVCPRTLGKTQLLSRHVIEIKDHRVSIVPAVTPRAAAAHTVTSPRASSITAEQFFDEIAKVDARAPACIRELQEMLEPLGVYEEFTTRLIFKWDSPLDRAINLGMIHPVGKIQTRNVNWFAPIDLSHQYIEELAQVWGLSVNRKHERDWFVSGEDGAAPKLCLLLDKLHMWPPVITRFQARLRERSENLASL